MAEDGGDGGCGHDDSVNDGAITPLAQRKAFTVTNRDILFLNLSKLSSIFHARINQTFQGGGTLLDDTASHLARRLIKDSIHIDELRQAGYYGRLVELVADKMASFGV